MSTSRTREKADGELFKSTGIDDNATSTAITIDANNTVLVANAATPKVRTGGNTSTGDAVIKAPATGDNALTILSPTSHGAGIGVDIVGLNFAGNNYYNSTGKSGVYYQMMAENGNASYADRGQMRFTAGYGGQVNTAQLDSSIIFTYEGNIKMSSGQGIDFSANADSSATGASTTSELLDDYEEGTWTPTLAFSGNSVSVTYGIRGGTYTKVGRLVTGSLRVQLTDKGSSNGDAQITGLPYVCSSTNGNFGVAAPAFLNNWANNNMGSSTSTIDGGTSIIRVRYLNSSGAYANITQSQVSNNADIIYVFSYLTN